MKTNLSIKKEPIRTHILIMVELHIRINTPNSKNRLIDYVSDMLKLRIIQNLRTKICPRKNCRYYFSKAKICSILALISLSSGIKAILRHFSLTSIEIP